MKKKVILFVCAIICMFAIASCGSNDSGTGPTGGTTADDIETPTPATGNSSSTDVTSDTTKEGTFEKDPELTYVSIVFGEEVTVLDNDGSVVVDGKNIERICCLRLSVLIDARDRHWKVDITRRAVIAVVPW